MVIKMIPLYCIIIKMEENVKNDKFLFRKDNNIQHSKFSYVSLIAILCSFNIINVPFRTTSCWVSDISKGQRQYIGRNTTILFGQFNIDNCMGMVD